APREAGRALVGPVLVTLDASSAESWRNFSFRLGAVVDGSGDLAFKRYAIVAGPGAPLPPLSGTGVGPGRAGPPHACMANEGAAEPRTPAIASWYQYGFFTHVLSPKPHVWAVRTADGRYAKLEMVGYYCPGPQPGCPTFRYVFQGDGTTRMTP